MSSEILRKSLSLFDDDGYDHAHGNQATGKGKEPLKSTQKKGIKKKRMRSKETKSHTSKSKFRKVGSAIEEYNRQKHRDKTEDNIYYLTHISERAKMNESVAKTILDHSRKQQRTDVSSSKKLREGTVFTDRDFDQFEEEYELFS